MSRRPNKLSQDTINAAVAHAKRSGHNVVMLHPDGTITSESRNPPPWSVPDIQATYPVEAPAPIRNTIWITKGDVMARFAMTSEEFDALVADKIIPAHACRENLWDRKIITKHIDFATPRVPVPTGFVYFMAMGDFIKIGFSGSPEHRVKSFAIGNPYDIDILLKIPGSLEVEGEMHRRFDHIRHRGEWFQRTDGLVAYIGWLKRSLR